MTKLEVKYKQVGRNLNVIVGEEKFTVIGSKEELTPVKEAIALYDNKPTVGNQKAMMALLKPVTTKQKVEKEKAVDNAKAEVKKAKNKAKEEPKPIKAKANKAKKELIDGLTDAVKEEALTDDEIKRIEALYVKAQKQKDTQPQPQTHSTGRKGEY